MSPLGGAPASSGSGRRVRALAGAAVAAALLAGAGLWLTRPRPAQLPRQPPGPRPAPAASRPPARTGGLEIAADRPGARVTLDGRALGEAPQHLAEVPAGAHQVKVEAAGAAPWEREVQVIPGQTARVRAAFATEAGPASASLRVESDVPGAQVFLDRRFVGNTPADIREVDPGEHRLDVSAPGYDVHAETVQVGGGPRTVTVRFKEVRLQEAVEVVHKHTLGSCRGRLLASPQGLRYEAGDPGHAFSAPLADLVVIEADYLARTLRIRTRAGKSYTFTGDPQALLRFQQAVSEARKRLAAG